MKYKRFDVTPLIHKRIKEEIKSHKQTNKDIKEIINIENEKSVSRIIKIGGRIQEDQIEALADHWEIRKDYLLGIDNIRTNRDIWRIPNEYQRSLFESTNTLLHVLGIDFESCEMLCFKLSDIYFYQSIGVDIEKMFSIIGPYILEPKDNWESFKELVAKSEKGMSFEEHCFITNGLLFEDTLKENFKNRFADSEEDIIIETIRYFIHNCPKISIDGEFIGYSRNYDGNMNVIADTVKSLAKSLIYDEKRKDIFIYDVENSKKNMEKEKNKLVKDRN